MTGTRRLERLCLAVSRRESRRRELLSSTKGGSNLTEILNKGKGIDEKTKKPITVLEHRLPRKFFAQELNGLLKALEIGKDFSEIVVDDCMLLCAGRRA